MTRRTLAGLAAAAGLAVAGMVTSRVLGSRPDGVGSDGPLAPCGPALNCYRSRLALGATAAEAVDAAHTALATLAGPLTGRAASVERTPDGGLRAVFQSGPFRDDLTVAAVDEADGTGCTLYVRSASRLGESDLGVNRRRGEALLAAVAARLGAR